MGRTEQGFEETGRDPLMTERKAKKNDQNDNSYHADTYPHGVPTASGHAGLFYHDLLCGDRAWNIHLCDSCYG